MSSSKILLAQLGARRHYQQPVLLHQWGALDTLYTDFYAGDCLPMRVLRHSRLTPHLPATMKRMLDRYTPGLKSAKIVHFPMLGYQYARALRRSDKQNSTAIFVETGKSFCQRIIQHGLGNTDIVYGFNSACLELFEYAKSRGILCILDQTLAERSYYYRTLKTEEAHWSSWLERPFEMTSADQKLTEREQREQDLADQIICGSEFVKNSLIARNVSPEKITVIPLGRVKDSTSLGLNKLNSEKSLFPWKERSDGLHILFAGSVGLRKGIPYLLQALHQLEGVIPFVCKAAGSIELSSKPLEEYSNVCQFLGRVPRSEMASLYNWADVFVLPSLCEGSAMVIYEALNYGLPVITTNNTGSIVRNGLGGWIVPIKNADAISASILELFQYGYGQNFSEKLKAMLEQTETKAISDFRQTILNLQLT
ncbi:glycosyltransferase [Leptolyngbyaceae cyanobacterium CCMR0082]|uniref:Glycosyltransferase n=1 Tax=Adonisia turfae CCMR0082 TaxID=2304604 RepID=A0A6M0SBG1_9CYAN|nr:glycosyltransferase family 4 protein [Adonisia turfae]NEZ65794.1 glycosyltransferase [Adonisia turfae CCMR0082]